MIKFHFNNFYLINFERVIILNFYDIFDRIKIEIKNADMKIINIKIKKNLVYALIKIFDFKKRVNKKFVKIKK